MLIKQRKQFNSTRQGGNLFTDIISKITSAATSETGKKLSKAAVEGISKGVKSGAEEGSKQLIRKVTSKLTKKGALTEATEGRASKASCPQSGCPDRRSGAPPELVKPINIQSNTSLTSSSIDSSTRKLLDSLKSGSGIKTLE